ncbi:GNAT family N-acetyltransferase [Pseudoxanthomonas suwonensis]|jgi:Acetyltransferase (GNAT) family.|uniref:GNAT family N-acetyltransferase n=1 Tax=Pseudoxanthomonas suwonensis TaxID=314722 RepID=UPI0004655B38|nr:GNAT family N-acetyltransferase [Pseudoxanthomonas suwonensis]
MPRNRLPPWHEEFVLPNRRAILIRPIRPEDAPPLQGVFGLLGPAELRARFAQGQDVLDDAAAARLCRPDPKTELVLVGAEPLPPGEAMIESLARARIVPHTREAEYAILLGSHVSGLGLGRHMMQKLVKWSRGRFLDRLYGDTPSNNAPMLDLAASMGFRRSDEPGIAPGFTRLVLEL